MTLRFERFDFRSELAAQRALFRDAFPETGGTSTEKDSHYLWKFQGFPAPIPSYEYATWDGESLVGYYAAIPFRYRVFGEDRAVGMVCDVMTHTSMRGKGIFTKLGTYSLERLAANELDFTTGYPIRPEVIPGHLKVGWKIAIELPLYLKVLGTKQLLSQRKLGIFTPIGNLCVALYNGVRRSAIDSSYLAKECSIEALVQRPDYQRFLTEWRNSVPISLDKAPEFLRWRLGAPATEYRVVSIERGGELVGVVILRPTELKGITTLAIVDMMVLPGEFASLGAAHRALERIARAARCETICSMLSRHWANRYLFAQNGFLRTPFIFKLILRSLKRELSPAMFEEANWHLMWIDSDDV